MALFIMGGYKWLWLTMRRSKLLWLALGHSVFENGNIPSRSSASLTDAALYYFPSRHTVL